MVSGRAKLATARPAVHELSEGRLPCAPLPKIRQGRILPRVP